MSNTGPFEDLMEKIVKKVARTIAQAEKEFYEGLREDSAEAERTRENNFDFEELWGNNKGEGESKDSLRVKTRSTNRSTNQNLGYGKEILVDVFEDQEVITIVAGLPGVDKEDINIYLEDSRLKIDAGRYFKEIKLPTKVKDDPLETDFRNGVLTLKFEIME